MAGRRSRIPVNRDDQRRIRSVGRRFRGRQGFLHGAGPCGAFQQPVQPEYVFVEEPDDHAHQNGGHDGSFPDAGEACSRKNEQARPMQTSVQSMPVFTARIPI